MTMEKSKAVVYVWKEMAMAPPYPVDEGSWELVRGA